MRSNAYVPKGLWTWEEVSSSQPVSSSAPCRHVCIARVAQTEQHRSSLRCVPPEGEVEDEVTGYGENGPSPQPPATARHPYTDV